VEQARKYISLLSERVVVQKGGIWPLDLRSYVIVGVVGKQMLSRQVV